jgi:hypothetical protein
MDLNSTAYTGAWINWSRGPVLGATLTLPNSYGAALVSAVAVLVHLSGTFSWMTICYVLHQWRTALAKGDGLYHQQQAILRNASSDIGVLWQLYKIGNSWRTVIPHSRRRIAWLVITGVLHLVLFLVAGIVSSQLITAGNETLVKQSACGYLTNLPSSDVVTLEAFQEYVALNLDVERNAGLSLQQVQSCKGTTLDTDVECDAFTRAAHLMTLYNATCPFQDASMCITPDGLAVQVDTGMVDSQLDLGINAPAKDRIKYRHVTTCSPIKQEGFATDWINATSVNITGLEPEPGEMLKFYNYGSALNTNHTFWLTNWWYYTARVGVNIFPAYQLDVLSTFSDDDLQPVSNLASGDSDLALLFLQYHGQYLDEVNDPWFSAHQPGLKLPGSLTPTGLRLADNTASVLGCTHQYQICGTDIQNCSPLMGFQNIQDYNLANNTLGLNDAQLNTTSRVFHALAYSTMMRIVGPLGASVLQANNDMVGDVSLALPDNQWKIEVENLHNVMMTAFLRSIAEYAAGPQEDISQWIVPPQTPIEKRQCQNQILRRDDHMNFSLFAVVLIVVIAILLFVIYFQLESTIRRYQRKSRGGRLRNLRWEKDGLLDLQRIAYEASGLGSWKTPESSSVPVTDTAELFDFPEMDELGKADSVDSEEHGETSGRENTEFISANKQTSIPTTSVHRYL